MRIREWTGLCVLALLCVAMAACGSETGQGGADALPASGPAPIDVTPTLQQVPGVDMSRLTAAQQAQAVKIMQENSCNCGCSMTVFQCRHNDPNCSRSPVLGNNVVRLLAEGKTPDEVVKAVFQGTPVKPTPAAKPAAAAGGDGEMVFPVEVGDSYFTGPEDATVTLVSWLDYQ